MLSTANAFTPWLVILKKNPEANLRLICFHYGGGSASAFRPWAEQLPLSIELIAVQLPGREGRFKEDYVTKFEDLTKEVHSLGAINSFEWIRELKRQGLRQPSLYIPSGMTAPQLYDEESKISSLPEEEFVQDLLAEYGDTLKDVLHNKELRTVFIPQLRADFALLESYQYQDGIALDCPILAFAGDDEPEIYENSLGAWAEHTSGQFPESSFSWRPLFYH